MGDRRNLALRIRSHVDRELFDESDGLPLGTAIYSLADPREIRLTRYVGQTLNPRRRYLQHLNTARLWLPDQRPWWVHCPKLRPLYSWCRDLYRDGQRMPTMVIHGWTETGESARLAERARIFQALIEQLPILNVEREQLFGQLTLL